MQPTTLWRRGTDVRSNSLTLSKILAWDVDYHPMQEAATDWSGTAGRVGVHHEERVERRRVAAPCSDERRGANHARRQLRANMHVLWCGHRTPIDIRGGFWHGVDDIAGQSRGTPLVLVARQQASGVLRQVLLVREGAGRHREGAVAGRGEGRKRGRTTSRKRRRSGGGWESRGQGVGKDAIRSSSCADSPHLSECSFPDASSNWSGGESDRRACVVESAGAARRSAAERLEGRREGEARDQAKDTTTGGHRKHAHRRQIEEESRRWRERCEIA